MEVLTGRTRSDSLSYRFRLSDGGEGGLNITHISQPQNLTAFGRFKPTSGLVLYIIEACRVKIRDTDPDYYDQDYESFTFLEYNGEEYIGDDLTTSKMMRDNGCNIIYEFDLGSIENPEVNAKYCIFCGDGTIFTHNPFEPFLCSEHMKC